MQAAQYNPTSLSEVARKYLRAMLTTFDLPPPRDPGLLSHIDLRRVDHAIVPTSHVQIRK